MQVRLFGTFTWLYIAEVLPSSQGTPDVDSPWNARFVAGNDWQSEIAWSGVEGQVWVQNESVFSVALALVMSPSAHLAEGRRVARAVGDVGDPGLADRVERAVEGGRLVLKFQGSLAPETYWMPLPEFGR